MMKPNSAKPKSAFPSRQKPLQTTNALFCPKCLEMLTQQDLEGYGCCPYCNHQFDKSVELEDFLMQPIIRQWTLHARSQMDDESSFPF
jgi:acetyl-CoA carboxylase beta subunit